METKTKSEVVHFSVSGDFITWILRHLWVEGNEVKALKMWKDTFPNLATLTRINSIFLPVVSGKKKFVGVNEFELVDDGTKYWDSNRDGKPNKNFPLLQSWEDVIMLKKVRLYISEMQLRQFRMKRRYPDDFSGCNFNTLHWDKATYENKIENPMRKTVNEYYTHIRNLTREILPDDMYENTLPILEDDIPLLTGPTMSNKKEITTYQICKDTYDDIIAHLEPFRRHFNERYDGKVRVFSNGEIEDIVGLTEERMRLFEKRKLDERELEVEVFHKKKPTYNIARVSEDMQIPSIALDVDNYVRAQMREADRERIDAEDPSTTEWQSGYIDRQGKFYGCSNTGHVGFAEELCDQFGFEIPDRVDGVRVDGQFVIDKKGWIKVSMLRFYWDELTVKTTEKQRKTILNLMIANGMIDSVFGNSLGKKKTFQQQFSNEGML